jgi:hypothetical protein
MSKIIAKIENTGKGKVDMDINQFHGGSKNGMMLQVTQGMGSLKVIKRIGGLRIDLDEPGFIHLTKENARDLAKVLTKWLAKEILDGS